MPKIALTQLHYFDSSDHKRSDQALLIENQRILGFVSNTEIPTDFTVHNCGNALLAAGFIDIQVNGGGGVMLNSEPTLAGIKAIQAGHFSGGTTAMLPTLITDSDAIMAQAVQAVAQALQSMDGILGIHLEGPHLSVGKRGVHAADLVRPFGDFTRELLQILPAKNYLISVAPEHLPAGTIRALVYQGIRVSAAHTQASYAQIRQALEEGLSCFTHLYNAMTPMTGREPGVVGAALEDRDSYCGIIVDGFHLHPTVAKLAIQTKARGKMLLVTDAMAVVGSDKPSFELYGETIYAVEGRCAKADGTLAGAALTMAQAVKNCVETLSLALPEALRMASLYPAQFLGVDKDYGRLVAGARADLVLLDGDLAVKETWLGGQKVYVHQAYPIDAMQ